MTLFSTLNEPYVLLLFLYLGACSGLIYFILSYFFSLLDRRKLLENDIANKNTLSKNIQKNTQTNLKSKEQNKNESNKKIRKENEKRLKKIIFFKSIKQIFIKIIIKIGQITSQTGKFAVFVALCFASFLINLKLNYGEINFICLAFFVFSFFIAGYFLKIVANFMRAIYTKRYKK